MMTSESVVLKARYEDEVRRIVLNTEPSWVYLYSKITEIFCMDSPIVRYIDDDGDAITVSTDEELLEMINHCKQPIKLSISQSSPSNHRHHHSTAIATTNRNRTSSTGSPPSYSSSIDNNDNKNNNHLVNNNVALLENQLNNLNLENTENTNTDNSNQSDIPNNTEKTNGSLATTNDLLLEDFSSAEIMQMLRDITYFIATRDDKEFLTQKSRNKLITTRRQSTATDNVITTEVDQWNEVQVVEWMNASGLSSFSSIFQDNAIDGITLLTMDHETLMSMGIIQAGKRMKIIKTIAALKYALTRPGDSPSPSLFRLVSSNSSQ